jgi:hypothetical protein
MAAPWEKYAEEPGPWSAYAENTQEEKPKKSAAYERGRNLPGALQGLASVAQGPSFGFADEIGGAVGA